MLFTNYHRYVDAFVRWALEQVKDPNSGYTALSGAGGLLVTGGEDVDPERVIADGMWRRHQMPAYHLISEGGTASPSSTSAWDRPTRRRSPIILLCCGRKPG
jgi:AMP nucleosidase